MEAIQILAESVIKTEVKEEPDDPTKKQDWNFTVTSLSSLQLEGGEPCFLKTEVKEEEYEEDEVELPVSVFVNPKEEPNEDIEQQHDPLSMQNEHLDDKSALSVGGAAGLSPEDGQAMQQRSGMRLRPRRAQIQTPSELHVREGRRAYKRLHSGEGPGVGEEDQKASSNSPCSTRAHANERKHNCADCGASFTFPCELAIHARKHTGERPFHCDVCGRSFSYKRNLTVHMRIHTGERPYPCDLCSKAFARTDILVKHKRYCHTGERPYVCQLCSKAFCEPQNLATHMRTHTGKLPYSCYVCGKALGSKINLVRHMCMHSGPYRCDVCGKVFFVKRDIADHMRTHTGERPHRCNMCGKAFATSRTLTKHKRTHTGERPYRCDVCGAAFAQRFSIVTHLRIHSGERPYRCDVCGRTFTALCNLNFHKRKYADACGKLKIRQRRRRFDARSVVLTQ